MQKNSVKIKRNINTLKSTLDNLYSNNSNFNNQLKLVKGKIEKVNYKDDIVFVDLGLKSSATVPLSEFVKEGVIESVQVGDVFDFYLFSLEKKGRPLVSRAKALHIDSEKRALEAFENELEITGILFSSVSKIGIVDLGGCIGYITNKELKENENFNSLLMKNANYHVIDFDKKTNTATLSRKKIVDLDALRKAEEFFEKHQVGDLTQATVVKITDNMAFVRIADLELDAMLHAFDISWETRDHSHPSETLKIGQEIYVKIMKMDKETKKISVSKKHAEENPLLQLLEQYTEGEIVKGKITEITDYGAFLELPKGMEGLLHISELTWGKDSQEKFSSLKSGDTLEVKIILIEKDRCRINLSLKALLPNPCEEFAKNNKSGSIMDGKVTKITKYGMFITVGEIESLIKNEEISWFEFDYNDIQEMYKIDQDIKVRYLSMDPKSNRLLFSIKQITEDPFLEFKNKIKIGEKIVCYITDIKKDKLLVDLFEEKKLKSYIKKVNLPNEIYKYKVGDKITAEVVSVDENFRPMLSVKRFEESEYKSMSTSSEPSSASIADILGFALEDLKKTKK